MKDKYVTNHLKNKEFRIKLYTFIVIAQIISILLIALGGIVFIVLLIYMYL